MYLYANYIAIKFGLDDRLSEYSINQTFLPTFIEQFASSINTHKKNTKNHSYLKILLNFNTIMKKTTLLISRMPLYVEGK